jgi:hypothetical protein
MAPRAVKYTSVISIVGLQSLLKGTPSREREQLDQNKADSYIYYYFLEKGLKLWEKDHRIGIHICPMTLNPIAIGGRRREFRYGSKCREIFCDQISTEGRVSHIQPHDCHNYWLVY